MFISDLLIENYRIFEKFHLTHDKIGIPDGKNKGSGLTIFLGENGNGKTSLIDAISLGLATYVTDNFCFSDLHDINNETLITINAKDTFTVKKAVGGDFQCKGLLFKANVKKTVSKQYLNKVITSDNLFISTDPKEPKDGSADLRIGVNNPFSGPRFNDNEYLLLGNNRTNQIRRGKYQPTRFDRVIEDFALKYLRQKGRRQDFNSSVDAEFKKILKEDESLQKALDRFNELTEHNVALVHIDNLQPFQNSFLAHSTSESTPLIAPERLGDGYYILLGLLSSYYSAEETSKDLIVVIDEVELHLHPSIQKEVVDLLLELSTTAQVFITSHSTEVVKQISGDLNHKTVVLSRKNNGQPSCETLMEFRLPLPTASETNYVAFGVESLEYHNELFGHAMELTGDSNVGNFDKKLGIKDADKYDWHNSNTGGDSRLSVHSIIRHFFHHPSSVNQNTFCDSNFIKSNLGDSIKFLRNFIEQARANDEITI